MRAYFYNFLADRIYFDPGICRNQSHQWICLLHDSAELLLEPWLHTSVYDGANNIAEEKLYGDDDEDMSRGSTS